MPGATTSGLGGGWRRVAPFLARLGAGALLAGGALVTQAGLASAAPSGPASFWATAQEGISDLAGAAFGASRYVVVGADAQILTSTDGVAWTNAVNPDSARRFLNAVAYGGGQFVAVGRRGSSPATPAILTSPNGTAWTLRAATTSTSADLNGVAYGSGLYVAVGSSGRVLTSPDGVTWTTQVSGTTMFLRGVAFGNGQFVAVGNTRTVLTSPDGIVWTPQGGVPAPTTTVLYGVGHDGTQFIVVGRDRGIFTSPDGVTWTKRAVIFDFLQPFYGLATGGGVTAVVGDNQIVTSADGVIWTTRSLGPPAPSQGVGRLHRTVAYGDAGFVAPGADGSLFTSTDGSAWSNVTPSTARAWFDVAYDGTRFCAVGWSGAIASSPDGVTWTNQSGPTDRNLLAYGIVYAQGLFVAVSGSNARIHTSPDCVSWTTVSAGDDLPPETGITGRFEDIAYGNGMFVAVGFELASTGSNNFVPLLATSPDGTTWTQRDLGLPTDGARWLQTIAFGGDFVALGSDDINGPRLLFTSPDGLTWTQRPTPWFDDYEQILAVIYGNTSYVAVGDRIWTSPDGIDWTLRVDYGIPGTALAVAYGDDRFAVVGSGGLLLSSADAMTWTPLPAPTRRNQTSITFAPDLHRFVAVGDSVITYTDDAVLRFSSTLALANESSSVTNLTVLRSGSLARAAVVDYYTYDQTALAGQDYLGKAGTLTIPAGATSANISISIKNDTLDDDDEVFGVVLINPGAGALRTAPASLEVLIADDDVSGTIELGPASVRVSEGTKATTATIPVTRTGPSPLAGGVTVSFTTFDGSAKAGQDYVAAQGTLTFPAGVTTVNATVTILPDAIDEADEVLGFALLAVSSGATLGDRTSTFVTIGDDDTAGSVQFSAAAYNVAEASPTGLATITVTRTGNAAAAAVRYAASNGTATTPADFGAATGTLTFAPSQASNTFQVPIVNDSIGEGPETVNLTLSQPEGGAVLGPRSTAVLTIADNEPVVQFALAASTVGEALGSVKVTVGRTSGPGPVNVAYAVTGGTATVTDDFGPAAGTLTFGPTELSKTITIPIVNDTQAEGSETFVLTLQDPTGASLGAKASTTVTITDNEPAVQFSRVAYSVAEAVGSVKVTIVRTPGPGPVTVNYGVTGGTAAAPDDFGPASGALAFGATELSKTITILIVNDTLGEGPETFVLTLANPNGASLGALPSTTITITDNEPVVEFALAAYSLTEGAQTGALFVTVRRTPGPGPVTVDYGVTEVTADLFEDFGDGPGSLTFGPTELSKTIKFLIVNDTLGEGPETFVVTLQNPSGASLGAKTSTTVTILDNEPAVRFSLASYPVVSEAAPTHVANVVVARVGNPAPAFTVDLSTSDGTAVAPGDYLPRTETLAFAAGQLSLTIPITLVDDMLAEPSETIAVTLANPAGAFLGSTATTLVNVSSNDNRGAAAFDPASYPVPEPPDGSTFLATLTVRRTGPAPLGAGVAVAYATDAALSTAAAGSDYTATSGILTFGPGETTKTFTVEVRGDAADCEGLETVVVRLSPSGGAPPTIGVGQAVIGLSDWAAGCPAPPPTLLAPLPGAQVEQNDASTGCSPTAAAGYGFAIDFDWSDVPEATRYRIVLQSAGAPFPAVDAEVTLSTHRSVHCGAYVGGPNLSNWFWRVQTFARDTWGPFGAPRALEFLPCVLAGGAACGT